MATNAQAADHPIIVNALNKQAAAPHPKNGAAWADSAREMSVSMLLQEGRAGVPIKVPAADIQAVIKREG